MAFRLSNDLLQAVASTVCTGYDIVQVLDGLLDYVQQHEHNDDLEVQLLPVRTSTALLLSDLLLPRVGEGVYRQNREILRDWCEHGMPRFSWHGIRRQLSGSTMSWSRMRFFVSLDQSMAEWRITSCIAVGLLPNDLSLSGAVEV